MSELRTANDGYQLAQSSFPLLELKARLNELEEFQKRIECAFDDEADRMLQERIEELKLKVANFEGKGSH